MEKEQNYESHSFSVELASKIGLEETLILVHFYHWCMGNADNEDMFKDGHIWMYITRKRINEKYPYLTENKIKGAINRLSEKGLILISNYNKLKIDKTNWYALTDNAYALFGTSLGKITDRWLNSPSSGENNQAIQSIKQNYIDKPKENNNNKEAWRIDFNAYLKLIDEAREIILKDEEFKSQCIKFNPNMDFDLTLEKMIVTYWGTETGWNKKKASKGKSINMLSTLKKGFDNRFNIVYKQYQYNKKNKSTDKDVPMPKNYTRVPLHPALLFTDNEGLLNDGTFVKDGYRFYFSKTQGKAIGIPPAADPMPNDGDYDYNLNNGWYQID
mgnify:CR=1 FL=1|jgi:hypothetical protein